MDDVTKRQHFDASFQHGELHQSHIARASAANALADLVRFGNSSAIVKPNGQFASQISVRKGSN